MKHGFRLLLGALFLASCSGGQKPAATPTVPDPEATATATPALPKATPSPAFGAKDLRRTEPVPFPSGVVMYATDAVWEGPTAALRRYYRDSSGQFVSEPLLESTFAQGDPSSRTIVGVAFGRPGEVGAALCHGVCFGGPEPVTIVRSADGGPTWHDVMELESGGWGSLAAIDGESTIIRGPRTGDWLTFEKVTDSGRTVLPLLAGVPPTASSLGLFGGGRRLAVFSEDHRTIWDVVSGQPLVTLPAAWDTQHLSALLTSRAGTETIEVTLYDQTVADRQGYLAFLQPGSGAVQDVYRWREADHVTDVWVTGWLSPTLAIGRADFDQADYVPGAISFFHGIPALIDLERGTVAPIAEFLPQIIGKAGGPLPLTVLTGAFAKVVAPGDCLNVRQFPSQTAPVLGCYADRVVLSLGGVEPSGNWLPVLTPEGRQGWASSAFLRTFP